MHKKYCIIFSLSTVFLLIIQAIFIFLLDPYGFHSPFTGKTYKETKIHKPYALTAAQPKTVMIGNSRNLYSFEPLNTELKSAYNLSLKGIGIAQTRKLFEHSVYTSNIQKAIISLDFMCDPSSDQSVFSVDERFLVSSINSRYMVFLYKMLLYSSFEATKSSFEILKDKQPKVEISQSGRKLTFNEFGFEKKGYAQALFLREKSNIIGKLSANSSVFSNYDEYKNQCKTTNLDLIIKMAAKNNIQVSFFLNPVNIRYWEIESQIKHNNNVRLYQKMLIQEKTLGIPSDKRNNFLWFDFLKLNSFTTETLSYKDKTSHPQHWYESSHYQLGFGNIILNTIINVDFRNSEIVSNLKTENIKEDFSRQTFRIRNWRKHHSKIVSEINNAIKAQQSRKK